MGTFRNRSFNRIYIHTALQAIAAHGGESFVFVYLLKAGISVPIVFLCISAMFLSRMLLRQLVLPIALKIGLRKTFILGILLEAATYPLLSQVTDVGPTLVFYLFAVAMSSSFYWTTFHAYVAQLGNHENRGAQTSAMEFTSTAVGIIAPLMSATLLTYFNATIAFSFVGICLACAALPLVGAPDFEIEQNATVPPETKKFARALLFTDGLRSGSFHFTWLVALFITLGSSYAAYGGAIALAGAIGAVMGLVTGRFVDLGHGKRALQIAYLLLSAALLFRAFGYHIVWSAIAANAFAALIWPVFATAFNTQTYNIAKQSPCTLRFHIAAEGGWDFGTGMSCLATALLTFYGVSFFWPMLIGLIGCIMGYRLLAPTFHDVTLSKSKYISLGQSK